LARSNKSEDVKSNHNKMVDVIAMILNSRMPGRTLPIMAQSSTDLGTILERKKKKKKTRMIRMACCETQLCITVIAFVIAH